MPLPIVAAAVSSIGGYLAKNGLELLSGIFRGAADKGTQKVAQIIEEKTGIDINKAVEAQGLTEEELIKLKEFELQHQELLFQHAEAIEDLTLEREKAYLADRQNARALQVAALASNDPFARRFIYYFALLLTLLSFGFIFVVLFFPCLIVGQANRDLVNTIVGFLLGTTLSSVIGFFYGSSKGSQDKNDHIAALTSQMATTPTPKNPGE
jgi:hypothetical protein